MDVAVCHVSLTVWWEKELHKIYTIDINTENGDKDGSEKAKSVRQTRPTDNLPSSSGAPGLNFSSNTKRRGSKRGGERREREKRTNM